MDQTETIPGAHVILRVDGIFEALLGALLLLSAATGLLAALDLPAPATKPVVVVFGLLLIPLLPILWRAARAPRRQLVLALAVANTASAVVLALWVLIWNSSFHPVGAAAVLGVGGTLALLAALEAREVSAAKVGSLKRA